MFPSFIRRLAPRSLSLLVAALTLAGTVNAQTALSCTGAGLTGPGTWACTETLTANATKFLVPIQLWNASAANGYSGAGLNASLKQVSWSAQGNFVTNVNVVNNSQFNNSIINLNVLETMSLGAGAGAPAAFTSNPFSTQSNLQITYTIGKMDEVDDSIPNTLGPFTVSSSDVSGLIGNGTFSEEVHLTTTASKIFTNPSGLEGSVGTDSLASLTVTYSGVTAVPEAPTSALLAAGLLGLSVVSKRARRGRRMGR